MSTTLPRTETTVPLFCILALAFGIRVTFSYSCRNEVQGYTSHTPFNQVSFRLVAIAIILGSIDLPLEAIGLILAVDRILDMCRTTVNVFSDSCGAVIIARLNGEIGMLTEARPHT